MLTVLVALAIGAGVIGAILLLFNALAGLGVIALGLLVATLARVYQAAYYQGVLLAAICERSGAGGEGAVKGEP